MSKSVIVYGKDSCPYTTKARNELAGKGLEVDYRNVQKNPGLLDEMLRWSKGVREVPVVVEGDEVTVGWGGGA